MPCGWAAPPRCFSCEYTSSCNGAAAAARPWRRYNPTNFFGLLVGFAGGVMYGVTKVLAKLKQNAANNAAQREQDKADSKKLLQSV